MQGVKIQAPLDYQRSFLLCKFVVRDEITREILQIGGENFNILPFSSSRGLAEAVAIHLVKGRTGTLVESVGDGLPRAFHALAMTVEEGASR